MTKPIGKLNHLDMSGAIHPSSFNLPIGTLKNNKSALHSFDYRRDIDGLRAVAVLLVLLFHFRLIPLGKAGFLGVDMFFVISGFLIMSIVRQQLDDGSFKLGTFYLARIRRLSPALIVVLLFTILYGWIRLLPLEFVEMGRQVAAAQFYLSNVYYWRNFNYFGIGNDQVYLLHTWSLAVEEQFYLLFPLGAMALHRWGLRWFWPAVALAAVLSFVLNTLWVIPKPMNTFYLLPTRAWELLAGALLAGAVWRPSGRWANECFGLLGTAAILVAVVSFSQVTPVPGWFALLPVTSAVFFLMAGADSRTYTSRLLQIEPMVYVGKISYVLYLVHWPINVFAARELGSDYDVGWRLAMFALSFVSAHLVFHFVEKPVRHRQWVGSPRELTLGYGAALVLSAGICGFIALSGGVPDRVPSESSRLERFINDRTAPLQECQFRDGWRLPPSAECQIGDASAVPTWVVFGDSHAWAGATAFSSWLKSKGQSGWLIFRHGCPPLWGLHMVADHTQACHRFNQYVYDWIEKSRDIRHVFLVSTWMQAPEGSLAKTVGQDVDVGRSLAVFENQLEESLVRLKSANKVVYVWGPVPGAKTDIPKALALSAWRGKIANVEISLEEHRKQFGFFYDAVVSNRKRIDRCIISATVLCTDGFCQVSKDSAPLYFDNAHITSSSSRYWSQIMDTSGGMCQTP